MKFSRFSLLLLCLVASSFAATAQMSMFMKVMDPNQINGESTMAGYLNWTEVTAFNAGSNADAPTFGGGGGSARAIPKCFTISMIQDRMAYHLKREMFLGGFLVSVQLDFVKMNGPSTSIVYYRVLLEDVYVTAIEEAATDGELVRMNVSFTPARFRYTYFTQNPNGSQGTPVVFGWNMATQQTW